jgi:predicted Zn-dependent protease with MMP-like domain
VCCGAWVNTQTSPAGGGRRAERGGWGNAVVQLSPTPVASRPTLPLQGRVKTGDLRYISSMANFPSGPLAWRPVKAPSLAELEALAEDVFRLLPRRFRDLCGNLVIQVDDFPSRQVLRAMRATSEFDLLGLFQGVGLPFRAQSAPLQMPNMIWLYRRPILDYWADHDETLGAIVKHVLIHEIGHHFGLSDADMHALERAAS